MRKKTISQVLIWGGLVLLLLSLGADLIGLGSYPGFNWAQVTGAVVGLAAVIYGYWLGRGKAEA